MTGNPAALTTRSERASSRAEVARACQTGRGWMRLRPLFEYREVSGWKV